MNSFSQPRKLANRPPKKTPKEVDVDKYLLANRQLFLFDEIDEKSMKKVIKDMLVLDHQSKKPIDLWINSPGGSCHDGLALIDLMQVIKSPVRTIISGSACSMGALISVCGDERIAYKHAYWMQHPMAASIEDYYSFMKDRMKAVDTLEKHLVTLLKEHTELSTSDFTKLKHGEIWLTGEDLIIKGIVDKII